MDIDPRLYAADTTSILRAAGYNWNRMGGRVGDVYQIDFTHAATGKTFSLTAPRFEDAQRTVLEWLGEAVPTWAEVQAATLSRAISQLEGAETRRREERDELVRLASAVLARAFREDPAVAPCVRIWEFYEAPAAFRELSGHGGDEDWIALVPPGGSLPSELESSWRDVEEHKLEDGSTLYIAAHA